MAPFGEAEIPQPGAPLELAALAAEEARALDGAGLELAAALLTLGGADDNALERTAGIELAAIGEELARQAGGIDPAIGEVAGAAAAGEGAIGSLTGEVAADLATSIPGEPTIPPDGYTGRSPVPPEAPSTEWDAIVMQAFRLRAGRVPTSEELIFARQFRPDVEALWAWIDAGAPLEEAPPPPPPPPEEDPWAAWDASVRALFVELLGREASEYEVGRARGYAPELANLRTRLLFGPPL